MVVYKGKKPNINAHKFYSPLQINLALNRMKNVYSILCNTSFGLGYLLLCLLAGEVHPFSLLPMYDSFPNWAYAFYVSDKQETLLPNNKYFTIPAMDLAHNYYAICEDQKINTGYEMETKQELNKAGEIILEKLLAKHSALLTADTLQLHRVCYSFQGDSVVTHNTIMYERATGK